MQFCTIYFEVKEFGLNPLEKEIKKNLEETGWASGGGPGGVTLNAHDRVSRDIDEAIKQFKTGRRKNTLVL
jgi:hypothetical protein